MYDVEYKTGKELLEMEPNLNPEVKGGLYIPRESIIDPFILVQALAENANENGVSFLLNTKVTGIQTKEGRVTAVETTAGVIETEYVINAAALYCDEIAAMVGKADYKVVARRGQFYILDKNTSCKVEHIVLPIPTKVDKGKAYVSHNPRKHAGGPHAEDLDNKTDKSVTEEGLLRLWRM